MPVLYPLLFTFRERLRVADRFILVTARGRVSAALDPDDKQWWFYGVNPGALAGNGSTPGAAFADFRGAFRDVLLDFAGEAVSVPAFEQEVRAFFSQVAEETDREWRAAVEMVRRGEINLPIPRKPADEAPPQVEVLIEIAPNSSELEWEGWSAAA